jgi:hypothetical protein
MLEQSTGSAGGDRKLERAIVLQILSEDGARPLSRAQLARALGARSQALGPALERLSDVGVVCLDGSHVSASAAARHIDALGLIGI